MHCWDMNIRSQIQILVTLLCSRWRTKITGYYKQQFAYDHY